MPQRPVAVNFIPRALLSSWWQAVLANVLPAPPAARFPGLLWALLLCLFAGRASAQPSKETQIKAVLLFNLARFVDWPPSAFARSNSPVIIGIVGKDPFGSALDEAVAGEETNGRKIIVERFASAGAITPCHILFISKSEKARVKEILAAGKNQPILTVSEMESFTSLPGGMVTLYINERNKPRLRINPQAAEAENLKISSKLLQVAELTRSQP